MRDKTPQRHAAGFPCDSTPPPACPWLPHRALGSSIVPCPGFPLRASGAVYHTFDAFHRQEPLGLPKFFDVSLPACHGLRTPADLPLLAKSDALVLPSGALKPSASATSHVEAVPALQGARSPLRPTGYSVYASPILFAVLPHDSAMDARLDTGGWLALTRQGLSPCKRRQAYLGAMTRKLTSGERSERSGAAPSYAGWPLEAWVWGLQLVLRSRITTKVHRCAAVWRVRVEPHVDSRISSMTVPRNQNSGSLHDPQ